MGAICRSLDMARKIIAACLSTGDTAVDATVGNGRDTVFLARLVGGEGKVWAFDIQQQALAAAARLLEQEKLTPRVTLVHSGHECLARYAGDNLGAVMFNLGYLPGGDHSIVTRPSTTLIALETALQKLRPGGVATLIIYRGHEGGKEEEEALLSYCSGLDQTRFTVLHYCMLNQVNDPPSLLAIERLK
ncbi:MAG: class I SAM-dependent methyltransferase [Bacillota bacterium]